MEKNVRVIDEQGNEYEATYPKRAKGLVKNGRARFIDEHTICLACPPNTINNNLEENKMEENKTLTAKEVFEQIVALQKQITENSNHSLHRISDSLASVFEGNCDMESEDVMRTVEEITSVFALRESILKQMLSLYEKMYNDLSDVKNE